VCVFMCVSVCNVPSSVCVDCIIEEQLLTFSQNKNVTNIYLLIILGNAEINYFLHNTIFFPIYQFAY